MSFILDSNPWWTDSGAGREAIKLYPFRREPFIELHGWLFADDRRAQIVTGPRQVGKTVLLRQVLASALEDGWPPGNLLYANLKDERNLHPARSPGELVELMPPPDPARPRLLFLDEVTQAQDWWPWLGRAVDEGLRVVVADSSAATVRARRSGDSLQGRWEEIIIEGLSFSEFVRMRQGESPLESALRPELDPYLAFGAFPEHVRADSGEETWSRIRSDIVGRAIGIDLRREGIDTARAQSLFTYLLQSCGAQLDIDTACSLLDADKRTVESYLEALLMTMLVTELGAFHAVPKRRMTAARRPKIYPTDPCLAQAFSLPSDRQALRPGLFEAAVFKLLRTRFPRDRIFFLPSDKSSRKDSGAEIDFLVHRTTEILAIEVTTGGKAERKADAMVKRAASMGASRLLVVTDELAVREYRGVRLVPLHLLLHKSEAYLS